MTLMLRVKNLSIEEGALIKLESREIQRGIHFFLGRNGSGKTTLLKFFATVQNQKASEYSIDNKAIQKLSLSEISQNFSYLPQSLSKNAHLNVLEFLNLLPQRKTPCPKYKSELLELFQIK